MAYGARLESVLGESPRGFESPILRQEALANTSTTSSTAPPCIAQYQRFQTRARSPKHDKHAFTRLAAGSNRGE